MSTSTLSSRVSELLSRAEEFIRTNQLQHAAEALQEASRLDGKNPDVKAKWLALQNHDGQSGNTLDLLRVYVAGNDPSDGQKALQALRSKSIPSTDASSAIDILLRAGQDALLSDTLTSTLLSRNIDARKVLAGRLSAKPTETFECFFRAGEATFDALTSTPLEDSLWSSKQNQATAQQDIFRLCIATLIEAGVERLDWVMRAVARFLSMAPKNLAPIIDEDVIDAVLSCLDIRLPVALRSQATLATSKFLRTTGDQGEALFSDFITGRAAKGTNEDLIVVFSAAAAVFPIITPVAARLFLTDGFVQRLAPNLERNSEHGQAGQGKSNTLETAALELLSAACVDSACREAIQRYCSHWLHTLMDEREGGHKALAALVLAKISNHPEDDVTAKLEDLVLADDRESDQAVEGLAFTSLRPSVKVEIAHNKQLLKKLATTLRTRSTTTFGCLTVFTNLTLYRRNLTEEQKKISQLKAYANSSKPAPEDPLDDNVHVAERCRLVLEADIVPALGECCRHASSPNILALITGILLSLAREQKHRSKMAQQGAVKILLQIHQRASRLKDGDAEAASIRTTSAHALARLLISLNPDHTFSSGLPASNAVSALAPLLVLNTDEEQRDLLPTFEALLALTNLASMDDENVRELEIRLVWTPLEDQLLLSPNTLVQRASVELICNLMNSPNCAAKFVGDGSKREATRVQILLALTDATDLATRRAAGGALAMLTEWDAAVTAILDQNKDTGPNGVKALLRMCTDESDEVSHRGIACVSNVVNAPGEVGRRGVEAVKQHKGKEIVTTALKQSKNREFLRIGVEVMKKLM